MLNINTSITGNKMEIALSGLLDTKTSPQLSAELEGKMDEVSEIVFDFTGLEYLTSAGLRVLLAAQQNMEDKDGSMRLLHVNDEIMEVFDMTGFTDVLTIE